MPDIYDYKNKLVNTMDDQGNSPLEVGARFNNEDICRKLLDHIKASSQNDGVYLGIKGRAALEASQAGHLNILKLIVWPDFKEESKQLPSNETKTILQVRDKNNYTCLHFAAAQGKNRLFY